MVVADAILTVLVATVMVEQALVADKLEGRNTVAE
jgi:hypothetical protein